MYKRPGQQWQGVGVAFTLAMLLVAFLVSLNFTSPAQAQFGGEPTPTPNDPLWRAYLAARAAVEEERSVDLTFVQRYTFDQEEYTYGIDYGCDSDVLEVDVRPAYFGWTFRITDMSGNRHMARVAFDLTAVAVCDEYVEGSAPAPDPADPNATADPNLDLPAPIAGSGATGAFELGGHVTWLTDPAIQAMRSSGMTWVKKQLRYNVGDNAEGLAADYVNVAQANGFKILIGIVGYTDQMGDFDSYITAYADFAAQVAAKGADAIEVWNEPNIAREWPEGTISGANYTRLLAAAFNSIKAANPNTIVISGAPAPTGAEAAFPGQVVNDDNFMRQMAQAGAGSYFDCVGLHYNEGIVSPGTNAGDPRGEFPTRYFSSMLNRGKAFFPDKPVCWTELGYLTPEGFTDPLPANFNWAANVTLAQHASWLADAASRSANNGVRLMIIWNINFEGIANDPMGGYAIIRPDGTCPACGQLGRVMGG
jgi:hypothetical protein